MAVTREEPKRSHLHSPNMSAPHLRAVFCSRSTRSCGSRRGTAEAILRDARARRESGSRTVTGTTGRVDSGPSPVAVVTARCQARADGAPSISGHLVVRDCRRRFADYPRSRRPILQFTVPWRMLVSGGKADAAAVSYVRHSPPAPADKRRGRCLCREAAIPADISRLFLRVTTLNAGASR